MLAAEFQMLRILFVEDNAADAHMLEMALQGSGAPVSIMWLNDGFKAADYLTTDNGQTVRKRYDLVILDVNLPGISGFELLDLIRSHETLRIMPVIMMSGSEQTSDINRCYAAGANSYIQKYSEIGEIFAAAAHFVRYWSTCVTLPSSTSNGGLSQKRAMGL